MSDLCIPLKSYGDKMNIVRNILKIQYNGIDIVRNYALKTSLKIKWVRPEKIPCYKPAKSGDLEGVYKLDKSETQWEFRNSKELENADDTIKRLFSLEFASSKKNTQLYVNGVVSRVKRHPYDDASMEVKIARMTGAVRAFQECMEQHPRNRKLKVILKELIDKRKKYLKHLRRWDYKRFEWILECLNIEYKPAPSHFHWIARKESLRKLTDKYCENIKNERLEAYKKILEKEQPIFLQEKIRTLEFIREEQMKYLQPPAPDDQLVTEEEIEKVRKQLDNLNKKNKENE